MPRKPRKSAREPTQAYFKHKRRYYIRDEKRWERLYQVYLPASRPFLPSDYVLSEIFGKFRSVILHEIHRHHDRDFVFVRARDMNFFRSIDPPRKLARQRFLQRILEQSQQERILPTGLREMADELLAASGCTEIKWTGKVLLARKEKYETFRRKAMPEELRAEFKKLEYFCGAELPFIYKAAPS